MLQVFTAPLVILSTNKRVTLEEMQTWVNLGLVMEIDFEEKAAGHETARVVYAGVHPQHLRKDYSRPGTLRRVYADGRVEYSEVPYYPQAKVCLSPAAHAAVVESETVLLPNGRELQSGRDVVLLSR